MSVVNIPVVTVKLTGRLKMCEKHGSPHPTVRVEGHVLFGYIYVQGVPFQASRVIFPELFIIQINLSNKTCFSKRTCRDNYK